MASICTRKNGTRAIMIRAKGEKAKTIRLGKVDKRFADATRLRIEKLHNAKTLNMPVDQETATWLAGVGAELLARLVRAGLAEPRQKKDATSLAFLLDAFLQHRSPAIKRSTKIHKEQTTRVLVGYFGESRSIETIDEAAADDWCTWLRTSQELAENTIRRRCGVAKEIWRWAIRRKLVASNPFEQLKSTLRAVSDRFFYVSRDDAQLVLDACPDVEWRLLFALARFGGLRCPSEHLALRWKDIEWTERRMLVRSPKTEHHNGGDSRSLPIFPELMPFLAEAFDAAPAGAVYVIGRYRNATQNLRTQLAKIIRRAGLKPWPKLWQNLRSTRQTELEDRFPSHVVCAWIGNSPAVAKKHYLQVTDQHFARAAGLSIDGVVDSAGETATNLERDEVASGQATVSDPGTGLKSIAQHDGFENKTETPPPRLPPQPPPSPDELGQRMGHILQDGSRAMPARAPKATRNQSKDSHSPPGQISKLAKGPEALQNALQQGAELGRTEENQEPDASRNAQKNPTIPVGASQCTFVHKDKLGDTGLEPVTSTMSKCHIAHDRTLRKPLTNQNLGKRRSSVNAV